jgi:hypothetical protein
VRPASWACASTRRLSVERSPGLASPGPFRHLRSAGTVRYQVFGRDTIDAAVVTYEA